MCKPWAKHAVKAATVLLHEYVYSPQTSSAHFLYWQIQWLHHIDQMWPEKIREYVNISVIFYNIQVQNNNLIYTVFIIYFSQQEQEKKGSLYSKCIG